MEFNWFHFLVGPVEPKIWNIRKESNLKKAKSILNIANEIVDSGDKSVNRKHTSENLDEFLIGVFCKLIPGELPK